MSEQSVGIAARLRLQRGEFVLDVDMRLPGSGVCVLFGRSGCGKTSLLRAIAGLERAEGVLEFRGQRWQDRHSFRPPHLRPLGYVFQEASLFAHLDVMGNLTFGYQRVPPAQRRIVLDEAISLLGLDNLLQRNAQTLSGGQRQRVAIARALLTSPQLLLLDEPLASLDGPSKAEILPYLERVRDELALPMIYVTHAPEEVARLADQLILLENGRIQAYGTLNQLLTAPDLPLAHLDDAAAVLPARVLGHDAHYALSELAVPGGSLWIAGCQLAQGSATRVRILARDVSLALQPSPGSSILNSLPAQLVDLSADRDPANLLARLELRAQGQPSQSILARLTRRSADRLNLQVGMRVHAQIKAVALMR